MMMVAMRILMRRMKGMMRKMMMMMMTRVVTFSKYMMSARGNLGCLQSPTSSNGANTTNDDFYEDDIFKVIDIPLHYTVQTPPIQLLEYMMTTTVTP